MPLPNLFCNYVIEGKWNKNRYRIVKKLGEGAVGAVYEAMGLGDNKRYALKFGEDNISLNREYNILKELEDVVNVVKAYEIDDVNIGGRIYYFVIIEYVSGSTLNDYRKKNNVAITGALYITIILLKLMGEIHSKGYILGDTNLNNIIIGNSEQEIKFVDLGGVVGIGAAIKEFTPTYDRASWRCGCRISEPSYDIFSAAMILTQLLLKIDIDPRKQTLDRLVAKLDNGVVNEVLRIYIIGTLYGKKEDAKNFANALLTIYNEERIKEKIVKKQKSDYRINLFFVGSLSLFIFTAWLIFIK